MNNFFKTITLFLLVTLSLSAFSMDCARINGRLYPADEISNALASALKVKTCQGEAFKAAAEKNGETINEVAATAAQIEDQDIAKQERLTKRISSSKVMAVFAGKKAEKKAVVKPTKK